MTGDATTTGAGMMAGTATMAPTVTTATIAGALTDAGSDRYRTPVTGNVPKGPLALSPTSWPSRTVTS